MITVAGSSNDPLVDGSVFSFFEYYTVTYNGTTYPGQIYYGQELSFDPMAILGEDFTGSASLEIASVNQCGCSSDAVIIDITVNPTPVIEFALGCTDPQSNLAALEVQGLVEPFQIAVYPEGEELTAMSYNPVNDQLAIISAGEVYNITVIDENGCTATLEGVVAEFAVDFEASISCIDDNGMVSVSILVDENTGYGSPYEYSYDGGLTYTSDASMMLSAVANPNISVAVRDQKGCLSGFQTFTLGDNGSLAPTATCADANGMVTIDLGYSGTNFNAFYSVDGGADVALTSTVFDLAVSSASTITFTVIDNSSSATGGCELTGELTVYPMLDLVVNPSSDCPVGGVATSITATGGNSPFALTINGEDAGSFSAVAIETLMPGAYAFEITDASGCTSSESITIEDVIVPTPTLVYNTSLSSATSVCGGEELTLEVTGGSSYAWAVDGVTQLETGNLFIATYDESKLITVSITDANGCTGDALEIPITFYPALDNTEPTVVCNGDGTYTVSFGISGGNVTQPYFVEANGVVFENFGTVSATYNLDVPYSFNITSPESGCSLLVSGSDACEDPNLGQGCNPILTQGNLNCDNGEVTISVTNAGPDFDVLGITGGASTDVNVESDGFGTVLVSFTLDASNTGTYTMNYNPGGNGCEGTIDFPISVDCNSVTAIELVRFEGEVLDAGNNLSWTTANEIDSEFFTVERSLNGSNFQAIGTVAAKGNTSVNVSYNFLDVDAPTGVSYYRLVETDVNGLARIVSDIVDLTRVANNGFGVVSVYPVPTSNTVTIEFTTLNTDDSVIANIFDMTGKLVDVINYDTTTGVNEMNVSVADYAAGSYFVTLIQGNEVTNTKFIKK